MAAPESPAKANDSLHENESGLKLDIQSSMEINTSSLITPDAGSSEAVPNREFQSKSENEEKFHDDDQTHHEQVKSAQQQPPKSDQIRLQHLKMPIPMTKRTRVLSLDRRRYIHQNEEDEDDDNDLFSQNSSDDDDGSYFSEQHLSPSNRNSILPPRRATNSRTQSYTFQKSSSFGQNSFTSYGSMHQDSDLSLSSDSNDDVSQIDERNLKKSFPMVRTASAPEYRTSSNLGLKPRPSDTSDELDLGSIVGSSKPPKSSSDTRDVIASFNNSQSKSRDMNTFPSSGSMVSSSSEDMSNFDEDSQQNKRTIDNGPYIMKAESRIRSSSMGSIDKDSNVECIIERPRHKRTSSIISGPSNKRSQKKPIPLQGSNLRASSMEDVESELSDADSYANYRRRRPFGHKRQESYHSIDSRIPLEIPSPSVAKNKSTTQPGFHGLDEDQLKLWQSGSSENVGLVRSESYMSSSVSPDRRMNHPMNNNSAHSMSASNLVYSSDDGDESSRLLRAASEHGMSEVNEIEAAGIGRVERRGGRSFGRDLTNADSAIEFNSKMTDNSFPSLRLSDNASGIASTMSGTISHRTIPRGDDLQYQHYRVYWQRWLMLMYMSILNLLSDWTCFSVAPIAMLMTEAYGDINPEHLVTIFLSANAISTAIEPILLSRLGLRRTVVFGSFLLMCGSVIKSGGIPGVMGTELTVNDAHWRIYIGFMLVGLSQPLYQCTPTLLSCSWFPERERTFATGIALNSNQLGIGFAFMFGTLLVLSTDDIPKYFGLLSIISTLTFIGCFFQFQDAPPSPPSDTARVVRGTIEVSLPNYVDVFRRVIPDGFRHTPVERDHERKSHRHSLSGGSGDSKKSLSSTTKSGNEKKVSRSSSRKSRSDSHDSVSAAPRRHREKEPRRKGSSEGRHRRSSRPQPASADNGIRTNVPSRRKSKRKEIQNKIPSPVSDARCTNDCRSQISNMEKEFSNYGTLAPSPVINDRVGRREYDGNFETPHRTQIQNFSMNITPQNYHDPFMQRTSDPNTPFPQLQHPHQQFGMLPNQMQFSSHPNMPGQYFPPHFDPRLMGQPVQSLGYNPYGYHYGQSQYSIPQDQIYNARTRSVASSYLPASSVVDDGAEPVLSQAGNIVDIDIRDDQILRSIKACFSRKGFIHTIIAFGASGIVLNTLSTYMDYLVRLGGSGRQTVGMIGGLFQILVMLSSIVVGKFTDKSRSYYSVVIVLLVLGAFALAECNINLDSQRTGNLKGSLLLAAVLVGPLQPISTELAVDVAFPLCSNTVLVIQQLVSNLFSAMFIPLFQALRNYGIDVDGSERPQYTFSFYLLIVIHGVATVFFATFNGKYRRLEHEQTSKKEKSRSHAQRKMSRHSSSSQRRGYREFDEERIGLLS